MIPSTASKRISCIIPVYNEEAGIAEFIAELSSTLKKIGYAYEIILVDDGSQDNTATVIQQLRSQFTLRCICFSRNFGKENAISAGLDHAQGDAVILIDADFQHPLDLLSQFIAKWEQ